MTMIQIEATTVPEILKATRALAGLTSREIAPMIGVSHAAITRWERGEGEPSVTQFMRWALATKQPAQQLLDGLNVERAWRDSNPQPSDWVSDGFWTSSRADVLAQLSRQVEPDANSTHSEWVR